EGLVVELELPGVERGRDGIRIPHQRIAVGLLRAHVLVADGAAGARPVHHQYALAELFAHAIGEHARGDVGGRAGGEEHRDLDRAALREWVFLAIGAEGEPRRQEQEPVHPRISLTSTRRPSFAERMPARMTASDAVARSPFISGSDRPRTARANSYSSSTR